MASPAVRSDIQIGLGCRAAICEEIGDRLRIALRDDPKGLPRHMTVLIEQIARTDGGRPSLAPLLPGPSQSWKAPWL